MIARRTGPRASDTERRQRRVALLVGGCFFMELMDGTIVVTSAPRIAASLSVPVSSISLVISAYLVTLGAMIPLSGWVAARFGARRVFLSAIVVFTLASLGCALSGSLPELVGMRVLQGVGGAMMVPVGRLVVFSQSAKADLMRAVAYIVWPALIAPVIAPLAGGVITTYASWHWLFLINVPLGAFALVAAARIIRPPAQPPPGPLDVAGVVLTCTGLAGLAVTAEFLARTPTNWGLTVGLGVVSALALALAVRHLLRTDRPLIDLRTMRIDTFRSAIIGSAVYFMVIGAVPFLVPLKFQEVFGWSAVKSGAVVLFIFVGNIAIKPTTTFLYGRFGFRTILIASTVLMAMTLFALAFITASTLTFVIALILLASGIARSVGATGYSTVVYSDVPDAQMGHANTLQATVQQLAAGLGVAAGAIALRLGHPIGEVFAGRTNNEAPYTVAFVLAGLLSLVATVVAIRLRPNAGDILRGSRSSGTTGQTQSLRPEAAATRP